METPPRKIASPEYGSLAFGGRGVYYYKGFKSQSCSINAKFNPEAVIGNYYEYGDLGYRYVNEPHLGVPCSASFPWVRVNSPSLVIKPCFSFDSTLGFPGEGPTKEWSREEARFTMAAFNTRSLTFERFNYCKGLGYDVLALTELWRTGDKFTNGTLMWTHSKPVLNKKGEPRFPEDRAAGTGILLSPRAVQKAISFGSPCERISWVRLKSPVSNLFIVSIYLPHSARSKPSTADTLATLVNLLKKVPKNDCTVILGDLNVQLPPNVHGISGNWAYGNKEDDNANAVMEVMRMFNLRAVNTDFQPADNKPATTFTMPNKVNQQSRDLSGKYIKLKYKGLKHKGKITGPTALAAAESTNSPTSNPSLWNVEFDDGFKTSMCPCKIKEYLIKPRDPKNASLEKQLDYILVSNRWKSSVSDVKVRWGPSIHRNGRKADHALVMSRWKWKVRSPRQSARKDWSILSRADQDSLRLHDSVLGTVRGDLTPPTVLGLTGPTKPVMGGEELNGTMPSAESLNSPKPTMTAKGRGFRLATVCAPGCSDMNSDTSHVCGVEDEVEENLGVCQQKLTSVPQADSAQRSVVVPGTRVSMDNQNIGDLIPSPVSDLTDLSYPVMGGDELNDTLPSAECQDSSDPTKTAKGRGVRPATVCALKHISSVNSDIPSGVEDETAGIGACQNKPLTRVRSEDSALRSVGVPSARVLMANRVDVPHKDVPTTQKVPSKSANKSPDGLIWEDANGLDIVNRKRKNKPKELPEKG